MRKFESRYQIIDFDIERKLLVQEWTEQSSEINDDIFKSEMLKLKELCIELKPDYLIINTISFDYVLGNEIQQWVFENINSPVIQLLPHLVSAFVMPETLIPKLSLEQTLDGPKRLASLAYFSNQQDAIDWMFS